MNQILKEILHFQDWENKYNTFACKNNLNSINFKLVKQQNFQNFQNFIQAIVQKGPRKSKKRWVSNQRRILHILLNCISVMHNVGVQQFKNEQIQRIQRVFPYKDKYSIQYEVKKLTNNCKQSRRRWPQKQSKTLQQIIKKTQNKNKWNQIARQLFIFSKGEYFRQGKHCRERFYKLKSGKGQQSLSSDEKSQSEDQMKVVSQFHSHSDLKSAQNECFFKEKSQKQKNSNYKLLKSQKQSFSDEKNEFSKIIEKKQQKEGSHQENMQFANLQGHKLNQRFKQEDKIQTYQKLIENIACLKNQNHVQNISQQIKGQKGEGQVIQRKSDGAANIENCLINNQQSMMMANNPMIISWQNNQQICINLPANQLFSNQLSMYSMLGYPFNFQSFY